MGALKWGLKVLVLNCAQLPTSVIIFSRKFLCNSARKATNVHNCRRLRTSAVTPHLRAPICTFPNFHWPARRLSKFDLTLLGGRKTAQEKKNKFLGTEVPRNFSDQCSLDFAYFLCLFSGRRAKSSQELCSWELFFLILGGFSPSELFDNF